MSKTMLSFVRPRSRAPALAAGVTLTLIGGFSAYAVETLIFGVPFEIPAPAAVTTQMEVDAAEVFGPMPLPAVAMNPQSPLENLQEQTGMEDLQGVEELQEIEHLQNVYETYADLRAPEIAKPDLAPAQVSPREAQTPSLEPKSALIDVADVAVFDPSARYHSANPQAERPPIPMPRNARPILPVTPASADVLVAVRGVSIDPLLHDNADGTWPRRLDQVQAREGVEAYASAQNQVRDERGLEWLRIEVSGLSALLPALNIGN